MRIEQKKKPNKRFQVSDEFGTLGEKNQPSTSSYQPPFHILTWKALVTVQMWELLSWKKFLTVFVSDQCKQTSQATTLLNL